LTFDTRTKCLLLYAIMLFLGLTFLFYSYHFPVLFLSGVLLSTIGFHEFCHLSMLFIKGYSIEEIYSSILKFGMKFAPRRKQDAILVSLCPLIGVLFFFAIFYGFFSTWVYLGPIYVFSLSLPDIYILLRFLRRHGQTIKTENK
jgi:hypothetical protein